MNLFEKNKSYLIGGVSIVIVLALLYFIGEIILPFIFAVFIAFLMNPLVVKIQTKIKNRNLAITSLLGGITVFVVGVVFFFGSHVIQDTKRFVSAVEIFGNRNKTEIDDAKKSVLSFVDEIYESEVVQSQIKATDSLGTKANEKTLVNSLKSVYSFLSSSNGENEVKTNEVKPWNTLFMVINTILYTVFIMYSFTYFETKQKKYFSNLKQGAFKSLWLWREFEIVFIRYFRQRAKVVVLSMLIFILAFSLLGLPGAVLIGIITGLLTYASQFHYLSLPLVGVGCLVLSIEKDVNFFWFFGIALGVYILVSILEETVFFNKIMKSVSGMNPAITLLSFTLWVYVFGGFTGTLIALPLTQLIMIFGDKLLLSFSNEK